MGLPGHATPEGTHRFRQRFAAKVAEGHFRRFHGLWLSSVGLGTYLGDEDAGTDELYRDAVVRAVELGCNVLDSAIDYRHQRSERAMGTALDSCPIQPAPTNKIHGARRWDRCRYSWTFTKVSSA